MNAPRGVSLAVLALLLAGLLAGCDGRRHRGHQRHHRGRRGRAGKPAPRPSARTPDTSPASTSADTVYPEKTSAAGRRVYRRNCASCHGDDRRGDPPRYPSLRGLSERRSRPETRRIIVDGRRAMPPFSHLSDTRLKQLLEYLYAPPDED